jgi:hypothetical protein
VGGKAHATAIRLSDEGRIVEVFEDCEGKTLRFISEVEEKDGKLCIYSALMPFLECPEGHHCIPKCTHP